MKQVRESVFETNSSSVHAIVIHLNPTISEWLKVFEGKTITFKLDEYGWEPDCFDTVERRASYLWTAIYYIYNTKCTTGIKLAINKSIINTFMSEIEHKLGKYKIECSFDMDNKTDYYIDHVDDLKPWLIGIFNDDTKFYNYLFDNDSFVETGNDNDENDLPYEYSKYQPLKNYDVYIK